MKKRIDEIKEILKELNDKGIDLLELNIVNEIECQLDNELTDEQMSLLYCTVEKAYLKAENITIEQLVNYCIDNIDNIYDMNIWDIIIKASMY